MNTNMIHNILNVIALIIGVLITTDWTQFGLSAETAAYIAGLVLIAQNVIKLLMNVIRDGLTGLVKEQPPVKDS